MERSKSIFTPLRIEFKIASDLVMVSPIRFDALLQYFCIQEDIDSGREYSKFVDYSLPVRKCEVGGHWFWDVSNAIVVPQKISVDTLKHHVSTEGWKAKNINIGSGKYCSNILTFERKQVKSVRFLCYGEKDRITRIAQRIVGQRIGALRKNGFGLVASADVQTIDMNYACWDTQTYLTTRDIPFWGNWSSLWSMMSNIGISLKSGRCRPPYYPSYNKEVIPLIMEGSKINLNGRIRVI